MNKRNRFIWGMFGTFMVEVLRFYNQIQREHQDLALPWDLIFLVCFLLIGGGVGVAWNERSTKGTIIIGVTWPLVVASLWKENMKTGLFLGLDNNLVYAQSIAAISQGDNNTNRAS